MTRIAFKIEFPSKPEGFIYRLRNFGEDLHAKFGRADSGSGRDVDSITDGAEVEVHAKRHLS